MTTMSFNFAFEQKNTKKHHYL